MTPNSQINDIRLCSDQNGSMSRMETPGSGVVERSRALAMALFVISLINQFSLTLFLCSSNLVVSLSFRV